ncbi:hypothetical protein C0J50_8529 [Silurus asotus]|uniref:Uncharacterized protein n=1 Tax=Silurus asotus TaxID=30991 RepID=A0AAD5FHQ4_SILAS|nr:hypothetical protein C0J50_8529 [Silurus asotus]
MVDCNKADLLLLICDWKISSFAACTITTEDDLGGESTVVPLAGRVGIFPENWPLSGFFAHS